MAKLTTARYGKGRVRVLKILREGATHTVKEVNVMTLLQGDFESSYTAGDNTKVVPTDTIKNTINVLAKEKLGLEIEKFAVAIGEHFLKRYPQVEKVEISIDERPGRGCRSMASRIRIFQSGSEARMFTHVECTNERMLVQSGIRDLIILKSTGSGFEEYVKDEFTTLRPTKDRILATSFTATWTFHQRRTSDARRTKRCSMRC